MALGERLKDIRDDKDISIQELAANTKISADKLYNFEINNEKPNIFQLDKLAQFYNLSLSDIVNKEEVEKELKIRSWIANLMIIPAVFSFEFMNENIYISIFMIFIMYVIGFYSTHFGKMTRIMEQLQFENPLVSIIKRYLNRRRSYIISFAMFTLGIIMAIINYKTSFGFGILLALFGFFCILASAMIWDSNKNSNHSR
ncbi:XRE family transcriptional regulator [Apilactobacillus micheneri]|uniref:XRE family transcriptional regulator n=1 Tax=Apilactobacillus micheneri TaxID=1899430 RepID=A0A9Q8IPF7_9LACO|nr:helix-turn-helix transcriptional regulator [Apilactobacillus micheneri]TPR41141.1 XRE family transcriptional regulator [Apilactobacillus micheneri]TPR42722.1 XRE family transcriptional regulator [Apilactobacillus micheneri]TPR46248.1 XRE family transcriptional regulator [Apilactobacillus micheneri]TPR46933.1 XRE family transcriptional regulator [Apilactobacillus micheneri]